MTNAPIGIFDSGVGGLTVAREIRAQLPNESIVYIGDTAHSPYGPRTIAQIRRYSLEVLDDLVAEGVKLLVIACNSASAAVLRDARERYSVPVIEVIAPAVRAAVNATRKGRVGVIGTEATIASRAYDDAFAAAVDVQLFSRACPAFVEHVEAGDTTSSELIAIARDYLAPLQEQNIDTLVLGCTHYPLLRGVLSYVMGQDVQLVSSDVETAKDVYRTLFEEGLLHDGAQQPSYRYWATGDNTEAFVSLAGRILGTQVRHVEHHPTHALDLRAVRTGRSEPNLAHPFRSNGMPATILKEQE